jgi:2-polyprenyl-3-methyl-5-hydroxy-6-metoxy-1,4-benzoquinol methylase
VEELIRGSEPGATVLDLGCGNGSFIAAFQQYGWELYGLDASQSGVSVAREAFPWVKFSIADLTSDLEHELIGKCDVVLSLEVVEHIFLPRVFARNCFRFLKPGGILVLSTPYHGYLKNLAVSLMGRWDDHFTALWDYGHIKFWSARTITRLLTEAGFQVTRVRGVGRPVPYLWRNLLVVAKRKSRP